MIRPLIIILCIVSGPVFAQQKFELQEYTGKVVSFQPFWEFVYQRIFVDINGSVKFYNFSPEYGKFLMNNFKPGQPITMRANINLNTPLNRDVIPVEIRDYFFRDYLVSVLIDGEWVELPKIESEDNREIRMVLDAEIIDIYMNQEFKTGFIFKGGIAGYKYYSNSKNGDNNDLKKGDKASFIGYKMKIKEGYVLPVSGINEVAFFRRLYKREGRIKSLLYKQNSLCIGVVVTGNGEDISTSFPSNYGSRIKEMAEKGENVTIYFDDFKFEGSQQPPELHAMIQRKDSIKILEYGFYGGADIFHQHKPVELTGKITAVNKLPSGVIESIIVSNDSYVEIDFRTQKQLRDLLKKGREISVVGNERIKVQGEVYNRDFRIVTPDKLMLEGKTFVLKDL